MPKESFALFSRIKDIIGSARVEVALAVDTAQVVANWRIGKEIAEEERKGRRLAAKPTRDYGRGYSLNTLRLCRRFFILYPRLLDSDRFEGPAPRKAATKGSVSHASGAVLPGRRGGSPEWTVARPLSASSPSPAPGGSSGAQPWMPGRLHPSLGWRHYLALMRIEDASTRSLYEIDAVTNGWSSRELARRINRDKTRDS